MSTQNTSQEILLATDDQIGHLKGLFDKKFRSLPRAIAQALITNGDALQNAINPQIDAVVGRLTNTYFVTVNYDATLDELVSAVNTGWKRIDDDDSDVPRLGTGIQQVEMFLFQAGHRLSQQELDAVMAEHPDLVFDPRATLALGAQVPDLQRKKPYATTWKDKGGRYHSVCLDGDDDRRGLSVDRAGRVWHIDWSFAAVRKPQSLGTHVLGSKL